MSKRWNKKWDLGPGWTVLVAGLFRKSNLNRQLLFQINPNNRTPFFSSSLRSITRKLMLRNLHLHLRLWTFLRFISDIHRTFPGSAELAHLRGNYTQWFVVLIDLIAQFVGAQTVWSAVSAPPVRSGLWPYLSTFLTPLLSCFLEECGGFPPTPVKQWFFSPLMRNSPIILI